MLPAHIDNIILSQYVRVWYVLKLASNEGSDQTHHGLRCLQTLSMDIDEDSHRIQTMTLHGTGFVFHIQMSHNL